MTEDIVHEATYPHPPADVWRALTTREAVSAWLMETTFGEARVGHRFEFRDKPRVGWSGVTQCEVVEVVPERRLAYTFQATEDVGKGAPTKVAWEIEPAAGGGTRLRLTHSGFTGVKGWLMRAGMNAGWARMVRHRIPFVVSRMQTGTIPTRDEARAAGKAKA